MYTYTCLLMLTVCASTAAAEPPPGVPAEVHVGRTPEIIELADCCIAVSGSVSLELMYRRTPAVIVYRMKRLSLKIARKLVKIPYITLVNLLAGEELYPEFPTDRDPSKEVAARVLEILNDAEQAASVERKLERLWSLLWIDLVNDQQVLRFRKRQRSQQHTVDDREDRRRSSNRERQNDHRQPRECRTLH